MHQKLIVLFILIVISFAAGLLCQRKYREKSQSISMILGKFTLMVVIPYSILTSIWQLPDIETELFFLPLVGAGVILAAIFTGLLTAKMKKLTRREEGALVSVTGIYNLGALGNLCAFFVFGESGVAIAALYKLCEELIYFGGIYPYARRRGSDQTGTGNKAFWRDPIFLAAVGAIFMGLSLNVSGMPRPEVIAEVNQYIIPLGSFLMVFSVGLTFNLRGGDKWKKLAIQVSAFRAVSSPIVAIMFITLFDLWSVYDGLVAKVCILLSVMPTGFTSTIPTMLYRLDSELANTLWFYTYMASFVVLPLTVVLL